MLAVILTIALADVEVNRYRCVGAELLAAVRALDDVNCFVVRIDIVLPPVCFALAIRACYHITHSHCDLLRAVYLATCGVVQYGGSAFYLYAVTILQVLDPVRDSGLRLFT